jgi:hypothetical protein
MRKNTPIPIEQSDEFKLVADHGKFCIAFDVEDQHYHIWAKAPRKRRYAGIKHRGVVWGIVDGHGIDGQSIFGTLVRAEQNVAQRLRVEGSWQ